jgi:hypothetical protein
MGKLDEAARSHGLWGGEPTRKSLLAARIGGRDRTSNLAGQTAESGVESSFLFESWIDVIAAVSQRYGGNGKEQRCAQLCRVRKKKQEDKGEWLFGGAGAFSFPGRGRGRGRDSLVGVGLRISRAPGTCCLEWWRRLELPVNGEHSDAASVLQVRHSRNDGDACAGESSD